MVFESIPSLDDDEFFKILFSKPQEVSIVEVGDFIASDDVKKQIAHISNTSLLLTNSYIALNELYFILDYTLMIYYHNYYTKEHMLVDELLAHLHCEYDFNNDKFDEYAHSKVNKFNNVLMKELDSLIDMIKRIWV